MSGRGRRVDKRIKRTVVHLLWRPASKVPEAMRDDKATTTPLVFVYHEGPAASPVAASRSTATFLCHIDDVGDGECDESGRRQGAKRATARVARAMVTAMTQQSTVDGRWEGGA